MSGLSPLKQVLVADDSPTIHKAVKLTLPEDEFHVVTAQTGKEALDKVKTQEFDLVLADVNMPELSGYDLAQAIKVRLNHENLPIILMCGTFDKFDQDRFIWCKANHRIWKPFETTSFLEIVRQYIQVKPKLPPPPKPIEKTKLEPVIKHEEPKDPIEVKTKTENKGFQVEREVRKWLASDSGKMLLSKLVQNEVQEVLAKIEKDLIEQLQREPLEEDVPHKVNRINPI
jgi:CheY-like chemotaxis protein